MVQVENEFGSYGKDTDYLKHLVDQAKAYLGKNTIIYTTDGGSKSNLENGTLLGDDVYSAVDFPIDWDAAQVFALQKMFNGKGKSPSLISEFYTGWLTHWTENIMITSPEQTAAALEKILSLNASAVLYMAHGGTNFGFFSGANSGANSSIYKADITSYDYISGFVLYETLLPAHSKAGSSLSIPKLHDRAQVFIWTKAESNYVEPCHIGNMERWSNQNLTLPSYTSLPGSKLQILVENMGRLNYGPFLFDPKGILSSVLLDGVAILEWTIYSIPLDNLSPLKSTIITHLEQKPLPRGLTKSLESSTDSTCGSDILSMDIGFYFGVLPIEESQEPADSFISMKGWTKGLAFVNGFNLGRYWTTAGPQCTLYIPGPLLHHGENELLIFELEKPHTELEVELVQEPDFTCGLL